MDITPEHIAEIRRRIFRPVPKGSADATVKGWCEEWGQDRADLRDALLEIERLQAARDAAVRARRGRLEEISAASLRRAHEAGAAAEREACAKVADDARAEEHMRGRLGGIALAAKIRDTIIARK